MKKISFTLLFTTLALVSCAWGQAPATSGKPAATSGATRSSGAKTGTKAGTKAAAGEKPMGVVVGREQRLHLLAQVRVVATLAREERPAIGLRPGKGRIEEREHVFPAVGSHRVWVLLSPRSPAGEASPDRAARPAARGTATPGRESNRA